MCRTMTELEKAVSNYRELKAMKSELEAQLKEAENDIKYYMNVNEKDSEIGVDFTIKLTMCERRTLDSKRLEADLGSLDEYQKVTSYVRLTVK